MTLTPPIPSSPCAYVFFFSAVVFLASLPLNPGKGITVAIVALAGVGISLFFLLALSRYGKSRTIRVAQPSLCAAFVVSSVFVVCGVVWFRLVWFDCVLLFCFLFCLVWCGLAWCGAVRCGAVRCGAVRCGAVRCGAVRCCFRFGFRFALFCSVRFGSGHFVRAFRFVSPRFILISSVPFFVYFVAILRATCSPFLPARSLPPKKGKRVHSGTHRVELHELLWGKTAWNLCGIVL